MKEQASAVKKREDELGAVVAQMQFEKAKPVAVLHLSYHFGEIYSTLMIVIWIWYMLPPHLKNSSVSREQFKSGLKTWLFVQAYS